MRENEVPTRADIEAILKKVPKPDKPDDKREKRNSDRKTRVRTEFSSLPPEVLAKIESDLTSYEQWENEEPKIGGEV